MRHSFTRVLALAIAASLAACSQSPVAGPDGSVSPTAGATGEGTLDPTAGPTTAPVGTNSGRPPSTRPPGGPRKDPRLTGLLGPWAPGNTTYSVENIYDNPYRRVSYRDETFVVEPSSEGRQHQEHSTRGGDTSPRGTSLIRWDPEGMTLLRLQGGARFPCEYRPPVMMLPRTMRDGLTWEGTSTCGAFVLEVEGEVIEGDGRWTIERTLTYTQGSQRRSDRQRFDFDDLDLPAVRIITGGWKEEPGAQVKRRLD